MIKKVRFSFYQSSNKRAEGHFKNVFDYETKFETRKSLKVGRKNQR